MFNFYIDTIEIPSEMAIEAPELDMIPEKELIRGLKLLSLSNTYDCNCQNISENNEVSKIFNESAPFEVIIKLSQIKLKEAVKEAISIAEQLGVNCFRIDEPNVHTVCYMYLKESKWIPNIWNYKYKAELVSISDNAKCQTKKFYVAHYMHGNWLKETDISSEKIEQNIIELGDNWELIELTSNKKNDTEFIIWSSEKNDIEKIKNEKIRPFFQRLLTGDIKEEFIDKSESILIDLDLLIFANLR